MGVVIQQLTRLSARRVRVVSVVTTLYVCVSYKSTQCMYPQHTHTPPPQSEVW